MTMTMTTAARRNLDREAALALDAILRARGFERHYRDGGPPWEPEFDEAAERRLGLRVRWYMNACTEEVAATAGALWHYRWHACAGAPARGRGADHLIGALREGARKRKEERR